MFGCPYLLIHLLCKCTALCLLGMCKCIKESQREREVGLQPMQVCTTEVSYFMPDLTKGDAWEYIFAAMYFCARMHVCVCVCSAQNLNEPSAASAAVCL